MKFYVGLAISVFLLAGTASAQHANFGVKGGLNYYKLNNDNNVTYDARTGYHVGMFLHIHLSESFAIQPELLYSAQGARFNSGNGKVNLNLGYVNIPLMFQFMFDNGFRIEAGPQVGILTSAGAESNGNNEDIMDNMKKIDLGVGAGVSYINPPTGWGIYARYNHGLSNINENALYNSYNRGVQLGVLYLFQHN
jgi:hypothetical protein